MEPKVQVYQCIQLNPLSFKTLSYELEVNFDISIVRIHCTIIRKIENKSEKKNLRRKVLSRFTFKLGFRPYENSTIINTSYLSVTSLNCKRKKINIYMQ